MATDAAACTLTSTSPSFDWTDVTKWDCSPIPSAYPGQNVGDSATIALGGSYTINITSAIPNAVTVNMSCGGGCAVTVASGGAITFKIGRAHV